MFLFPLDSYLPSSMETVFSLLMRKDDACWFLGHQTWMTEMWKHFCRLKFCGWKTTYFVLLCMIWNNKPNKRTTGTQKSVRAYTHTHTHTHRVHAHIK